MTALIHKEFSDTWQNYAKTQYCFAGMIASGNSLAAAALKMSIELDDLNKALSELSIIIKTTNFLYRLQSAPHRIIESAIARIFGSHENYRMIFGGRQ